MCYMCYELETNINHNQQSFKTIERTLIQNINKDNKMDTVFDCSPSTYYSPLRAASLLLNKNFIYLPLFDWNGQRVTVHAGW